MLDKLRAFLKKHWDLVLYLIFGVLTTVVNFSVYFPLIWWAKMPASAANAIAWFFAVVFSYFTNKPYVFDSHDWSMKTVIPEFGKFMLSRCISGAFETLGILLTVDIWGFSYVIMKLLVSIFVILFNFVASKLFIFKKKEET